MARSYSGLVPTGRFVSGEFEARAPLALEAQRNAIAQAQALAEARAQQAQMDLDRERLAQQGRQFGETMALDRERFGREGEQVAREGEQWERTFARGGDFEKTRATEEARAQALRELTQREAQGLARSDFEERRRAAGVEEAWAREEFPEKMAALRAETAAAVGAETRAQALHPEALALAKQTVVRAEAEARALNAQIDAGVRPEDMRRFSTRLKELEVEHAEADVLLKRDALSKAPADRTLQNDLLKAETALTNAKTTQVTAETRYGEEMAEAGPPLDISHIKERLASRETELRNIDLEGYMTEGEEKAFKTAAVAAPTSAGLSLLATAVGVAINDILTDDTLEGIVDKDRLTAYQSSVEAAFDEMSGVPPDEVADALIELGWHRDTADTTIGSARRGHRELKAKLAEKLKNVIRGIADQRTSAK